MDIMSLVGGLGIGSVATLLLKEYFDNKKIISKRTFEEKREAYVAYLDIATRSQTMPENEATWARTAAMERIKLCGSAEVVRLLYLVSDSPPDSPHRHKFDELIQTMRKDLWG